MDNPFSSWRAWCTSAARRRCRTLKGRSTSFSSCCRKNKIEIRDIPIALILDQYLAYLEQRKQLDLEVASEFITMAAHLMYIKTRMLLSLEDEQAQSEMDELIASLKERQQRTRTFASRR